ncbi:amidase [Mycobacterium sp. BMJ-28]
MTVRSATRVHAFRDDALADLDATGVAAEIASGRVSAAEVVEAAITRTQEMDAVLNAVEHADFDRARNSARSPRPGVFSGVPTIIKDNTDLAGLPTNYGALAVRSTPAPKDAPCTQQFLTTGAVPLGKSRMPEFGLTASVEYENLPPGRNPWNTDYSCGGSSGGSAILVASGALPFAHATDGGGSIRIPAAACGLVGLKYTRGRDQLAQEATRLPLNIMTNGVLTRTVRDTATYLAAIERYRPVPTLKPVGIVTGPAPRRLRIGVIHDFLTHTSDFETQASVTRTADLLADLGHHVFETTVPLGASSDSFEEDFLQFWRLLAFSLQHFGKLLHGRTFDASQNDAFTKGLSGQFLRRCWRTPTALARLRQTEAEYEAAFTDMDVILGPVLGHTVPQLGFLSPALGFDELIKRLSRFAAFTPLNNVSGGPAVSLPLGATRTGLPLGLHFSAGHGDERTLLELAFELEQAQPFARITS